MRRADRVVLCAWIHIAPLPCAPQLRMKKHGNMEWWAVILILVVLISSIICHHPWVSARLDEHVKAEEARATKRQRMAEAHVEMRRLHDLEKAVSSEPDVNATIEQLESDENEASASEPTPDVEAVLQKITAAERQATASRAYQKASSYSKLAQNIRGKKEQLIRLRSEEIQSAHAKNYAGAERKKNEQRPLELALKAELLTADKAMYSYGRALRKLGEGGRAPFLRVS